MTLAPWGSQLPPQNLTSLGTGGAADSDLSRLSTSTGSPGAATCQLTALGCDPSWAQEASGCSSSGRLPCSAPSQTATFQSLLFTGRTLEMWVLKALSLRAGPGCRTRDHYTCFTEEGFGLRVGVRLSAVTQLVSGGAGSIVLL